MQCDKMKNLYLRNKASWNTIVSAHRMKLRLVSMDGSHMGSKLKFISSWEDKALGVMIQQPGKEVPDFMLVHITAVVWGMRAARKSTISPEFSCLLRQRADIRSSKLCNANFSPWLSQGFQDHHSGKGQKTGSQTSAYIYLPSSKAPFPQCSHIT